MQHHPKRTKESALFRSALSLAVASLGGYGANASAQTSACGAVGPGSYSSGFACAPAAGTDATLTPASGTSIVNATNPALRATANRANSSIFLSGIGIQNTPAAAVNGVLSQVSGTSAGAAALNVLSGTNNIAVGGSSLDAMAIINATAGSSTVTIAPGAILNLTNTVTGNEHDGIDVAATGGGAISLSHQGSGTISVAGGNGIWLKAVNAGSVSAVVGNGVIINVDDTNPVSGASNHAGVHARALGTGSVSIDNAAAISAVGGNAFGIFSESASGNTVVRNTGSIQTNGLNGFGIRGSINGGDISILNSASISTKGPGAHGIYASSNTGAAGSISIVNNGAINVGDPGEIVGSRAIYVITRTTGNTFIGGNGDINVQGGLATERAAAIIVSADAGHVAVDYGGAISAAGPGAGGIRVDSTTGNVDIRYTGRLIETFNGNANGIYASTGVGGGTVTIDAAGTIITHSDAGSGEGSGSGSFGLQALTRGSDVAVTFTGQKIDVNGSGAAIIAGTAYNNGTGIGQVAIANTGELIARGQNQHGIRAYTGTGSQRIVNQGNIQTLGASGAQGILAFANDAANINVLNTAVIATRGDGSSGIESTAPGGTVVVENQGSIAAGWNTSAGVTLGGLSQQLTNSGTIAALSDVAVQWDSNAYAGGTATLANAGSLTGVLSAVSSTVDVQNQGAWTLRRYADSTGDGARDQWRIAQSNLGTSGANRITNAGTITLAAQPAAVGSFDGGGAYLPFGQDANAPRQGGAVQGQILGVGTFVQSGLIDLTGGSSAVGNVLVISGGQTAGADGGGVFVANGGVVKLNTVLNEGGSQSRSDVLVVDSTRLDTAPTGLRIQNVGGEGAVTQGNGIAVVEIVNKAAAASAPGAFTLDGRAVAGAYEYRLFRGADDGTATDAWYLRTERDPDPPPDPPPTPPPDPRPAPEPLYRPEVAAYLANQRLVGQMFVHSMHDRLGEPQYIESQQFQDPDEKRKALWLRATGKWEGSRSKNGIFDVSTDLFLLQGGGDLAQWKLGSDRDRLHLGAMLGYGTATSRASADGNRHKARGKVDGYNAGLYGAWFQNDESKLGAYVDTWFQYGWFKNRVEGDLLPRVDYDSRGWAVSGEAGYAFKLRGDWVLEPQAQIIYIDTDTDSVREPNGTRVRGADSSGTITRLGVRGHRTFDLGNGRQVQPFATVNWWHTNTDSSISFNQLPLGSLYPNNRFELKLGAHANFTKGWTGWVNVAGSWGEQSYHQYAGRIGAKYTW
ncbi:autotransporter outer membrane beta-barrel domain-containing protein [Achromobacter aegrifaciens]|uniref:autotransporter outer membrane beta-barrel domain-containing protein n=1 Tax=Achromobacter aegrifaciens TaxID=1287736 RepID=UPI00320A11E7